MSADRTITARVQLRIAIDPAMQSQAGPRPPMLPQVIEVAIHSDRSATKTAAWDHEFWIDAPYDATAKTWDLARDQVLKQLVYAPFLGWMLHMLPTEDRNRAYELRQEDERRAHLASKVGDSASARGKRG